MSVSLLFVFVPWISAILCPTRAQGEFENVLFTCFVIYIDCILIKFSLVKIKMAVKGFLIIWKTNRWAEIIPNLFEFTSNLFYSVLRKVSPISLRRSVLILSSADM